MTKQFFFGLIVGVFVSGVIGGIIGISMVGKEAIVEPSDWETFAINKLKNMKIPESAASVTPIEKTEENLLVGGEHYNHHCAVCHDLEGDADSVFAEAFYPQAADLTSEHVQNYSDGQLKWIVQNGIRLTGMPGWSHIIEEATQWKIVYYIRALADTEKAHQLEEILKERGKWGIESYSNGDHHQATGAADPQSHGHDNGAEHNH